VKESREKNDEKLALWEKRLEWATHELNQRRKELELVEARGTYSHPDEVSVAVTGGDLAAQAITLSK
jgi:uncharacterized NAD-dependent epimerase/dehydratase family protein